MLKVMKKNRFYLILKKNIYKTRKKNLNQKILRFLYCKIFYIKNKYFYSISLKKIKYLNTIFFNFKVFSLINSLVYFCIYKVLKKIFSSKNKKKWDISHYFTKILSNTSYFHKTNNSNFLKRYYEKKIELYYQSCTVFPHYIRGFLSVLELSKNLLVDSSIGFRNLLFNLFINGIKHNNILFISFNSLSNLTWKHDLMRFWNEKIGLIINLNTHDSVLLKCFFFVLDNPSLTKIFFCTMTFLLRIAKNTRDILTRYTLFHQVWEYIVIDMVDTNLINQYIQTFDKLLHKIKIIIAPSSNINLKFLKKFFQLDFFFFNIKKYCTLQKKIFFNHLSIEFLSKDVKRRRNLNNFDSGIYNNKIHNYMNENVLRVLFDYYINFKSSKISLILSKTSFLKKIPHKHKLFQIENKALTKKMENIFFNFYDDKRYNIICFKKKNLNFLRTLYTNVLIMLNNDSIDNNHEKNYYDIIKFNMQQTLSNPMIVFDINFLETSLKNTQSYHNKVIKKVSKLYIEHKIS